MNEQDEIIKKYEKLLKVITIIKSKESLEFINGKKRVISLITTEQFKDTYRDAIDEEMCDCIFSISDISDSNHYNDIVNNEIIFDSHAVHEIITDFLSVIKELNEYHEKSKVNTICDILTNVQEKFINAPIDRLKEKMT